tara:strand:- start:1264 stop:1881 length:618 start_codon:yes stop_codon:yes gene_type:complete
MDIKKYNTFIFDFDGVIVDSNFVKKEAIYKSVINYTDIENSKKFVKYFIDNSGLPREKKIRHFFPENISLKIKNKYEDILRNKYKNSNLIPGVVSFIDKLKKNNKDILIMSGGDPKEIKSILKIRKIDHYFNHVYGGPLTKEENFKISNPKKPIIFFGDSKHDYLVSLIFNLDFIFVYGYTNQLNWNEFIDTNKCKDIIKDFDNI